MMNKNLKELASQSGFRSYVTVSDDNGNHLITKTEQSLERFAELIVRECADIALREDFDPSDCILKHFGLKR